MSSSETFLCKKGHALWISNNKFASTKLVSGVPEHGQQVNETNLPYGSLNHGELYSMTFVERLEKNKALFKEFKIHESIKF